MKKLNRISVFFAALVLATMLGCASTRTQESTGQFVDDSAITTKVKAAILNESSLKSAQISVETFKGRVQLSGFVSTQAEINKTAELARGVGGVTSVKNDMRIK